MITTSYCESIQLKPVFMSIACYICVFFQEMSGLYSPMMEAECTVPNVEAPSPAPRYNWPPNKLSLSYIIVVVNMLWAPVSLYTTCTSYLFIYYYYHLL